MSQSQKPRRSQGANASPASEFPRSGRNRPAGDSALGHAAAALARAGFTDATLVLRWSDIAGPEIARIAEPVRLQEGPEGAVLTLKCEAGAAVFLQHQTRSLIERLNSYRGRTRITRLKFLPGKLSRAASLPDHPARQHGQNEDFAAETASKPDLYSALERLGKRRATRPR